MIGIAALSREEREELFLNTAQKVGMPPAIVEKDFWVCYMLDYRLNQEKCPMDNFKEQGYGLYVKCMQRIAEGLKTPFFPHYSGTRFCSISAPLRSVLLLRRVVHWTTAPCYPQP